MVDVNPWKILEDNKILKVTLDLRNILIPIHHSFDFFGIIISGGGSQDPKDPLGSAPSTAGELLLL